MQEVFLIFCTLAGFVLICSDLLWRLAGGEIDSVLLNIVEYRGRVLHYGGGLATSPRGGEAYAGHGHVTYLWMCHHDPDQKRKPPPCPVTVSFSVKLA